MVDFQHLNRETGEIWNANADFWDGRMGEGNDFHKTLIEPIQLKLLNLKAGEQVLEIACGNGQFTRKMAEFGVSVLATDVAEQMIANATQRTKDNADRIDYRVLDATDESQLATLGQGKYDAAVCAMAIMDIASIEPLIEALGRVLKVGGRFVFSIMHPCFNSTDGLTRVMEREEVDGELVDRRYIKISNYIEPHTYKGQAMVGQPVAQNYFHRPISVILNAFFAKGFVLDGIEEPVFGEGAAYEHEMSWEAFTKIPPAFVARLRLMGN